MGNTSAATVAKNSFMRLQPQVNLHMLNAPYIISPSCTVVLVQISILRLLMSTLYLLVLLTKLSLHTTSSSLSLTDFAKPNKIHFFNDEFSHFRISSLHLFQFQFFLTKATRTVSGTPDKVLAKVCTMLTILSSLLEMLRLVESCTCLLDTYII